MFVSLAIWHRAWLALLVLGLLLAAACEDSDVTDQPSTTSTALPEPTIIGSKFVFPGRGYEVAIPDGWHSDANTVAAGPMTIDGFFSASEADGVQANISVSCEENPSGASTGQYVESRLKTVQELAATDLETLDSVAVGDFQGDRISYTLTRGETTIRKVDVMVVTPRCAWTIALATAPAHEHVNLEVFDKFLAAFRFIDKTADENSS